ncbi:MAG: peptidoglycan DD-metalloendopeptidase family protein [Pseudomonadota bacterium]
MLNGPATAQQSTRARLARVEHDRSAAAAEAQRLRRQAANTQSEINALNARLVDAGRRRAAAEAAMLDAEQRLADLRQEAAAEAVRQRHDQRALEAALIAAAFAERDIDLSAQHAGVFARAAAPSIRADLEASDQALDRARQHNDQIAEEEAALAEAQQAIDAERTDVAALLTQRRALQISLAANADAAEQRARQLAAQARSLRELAQRVAPQGRHSPSTGSDVIPASWTPPASGVIRRSFGASASGGPASQGVTLRTHGGAQVLAPASARVAYAGLFRSYGQVLILNLDGGYAVVLTGLGTIRVRVGEEVLAGQPVGEMSVSDTPAPDLYVEVRRNGRPIDPARWLSARGLANEAVRESPG